MSNLPDCVVRRVGTGEEENVALDFWRLNCDIEGEGEANSWQQIKRNRTQVFNGNE
jgi:hypothetical protein